MILDAEETVLRFFGFDRTIMEYLRTIMMKEERRKKKEMEMV